MIAQKHALLDFGAKLDPSQLFPVLVPAASELVAQDAFAFTLATSLDRGTKAEIIWTIPYDIKRELGHLGPIRIEQMTLDELDSLYRKLPRRPRYIHDAPRTTHDLARIVVHEFGGDAASIWQNRSAADAERTFRQIHGVGPGIASMAVLLIEKRDKIRFSDLDHRGMDVKADVHVQRVLYRLGIIDVESEYEALAAARQMHPEYPGELDAPLWAIGRNWCYATGPDCENCPMTTVCPKTGVS